MKFFAFLLVFLAAFQAAAIAADVKAMMTEANTQFRSADRDFMSGKMDSAWDWVIKAKETIAAVLEADPSNTQAAQLGKRIDQLAERIEKRRGAAPKPGPAAGPAPAGGAAPKRLPATASRYLMEADRALGRVEMLLGPDRDKQDPARLPDRVREALAPVEQNLGKLTAEFPDFSDHPDVTPKMERLEAARKELQALEGGAAAAKAAGDEALAAREAESGEWLKKLRPFVASKSRMDDAPYYDPDREMLSYAGFDTEIEELARRHKIHGSAGAALEEYKKAAVVEPLELLAETAGEIESRLAQFEAALEELGRIALREARTQLDFGREFMDKNLPAAEKGEEFVVMSRDVLAGIKSRIDQAAVFLPESDQPLAEARADLEKLGKDADVLAGKRVEKTVMAPENYSGADIDDIKAAVRAAVETEHGGGEILRVNVLSRKWGEDWRFQEGADRVIRLTAVRQVSVQAAVKKGGEVLLLTLGVYSEKNPDWSWGPMKGHVHFTDRMLEENVNK